VNGNSGSGGAIAFSGSMLLSFFQCSFVNNSANSAGGAVYLQSVCICNLTNDLLPAKGATVNIYGSLFNLNQATGEGGALCFNGTSSSNIINNSTFSFNTANEGGAIYATDSRVNATNTIFTSNHAEDSGGSLYLVTGAVIELISSAVWNCSSHAEGGGAYIGASSTVFLIESKLAYCVSGNGAGIHAGKYF
jgi:predicted outer membrane repeat protein